MKYKVISQKKLRVRTGPSSDYKIKKHLKRGTIVEVDKIKNGWAHYVSGGWSDASLLKKVEEPKPKPKPKPAPARKETNAEKIARIANELAYSTNTSKARYPNGKPTDAYYKAFRKAYPASERKKWKDRAHRLGANCGANVGTTIRTAGIDKTFPHTAAAAMKRFEAHPEKWQRIYPDREAVQDGDIIDYKNKNGKYHICIHYKQEIKEGSYGKFYPKTTNSLNKRLDPSDKAKLRVFRAKG